MSIESEHDLIALQKIGRIVAMAREEMLSSVQAGITTAELDRIGKRLLDEHGAVSAPYITYGFPGTTCISVNEVAAHGIPGPRVLKEGDVVNIDVSAELGGYYADTGATTVVGSRSPHKEKLCQSSLRALQQALKKARAGAKVSGIGRAIHNEARKDGFTVIRNLAGHGIGRKLHEMPDGILNYYEPRDNRLLTNGLVLAVETFVSDGAEFVDEGADGWGLLLPDNHYAAQFEHTIVITKDKPLILTA
ncbi:type I methionyl aminopeptidase [Shouchella clausii]|uniref:Methionine aminopeptidase n=1 Tax=Shouchella clausii TaxID=79880 RepID=A0A268RZQ8_SHOCL|nr:type I methionyl aminopeptidase [Shouchella clausii]PAD41404.1 type I methionyl aminopeptidase [Bacillus sp. 7520-S]MBU8595843.1 type I methionyl aminopeptidase [Shouchella clausii]MCY1106071.1 type I methionyl aminopeptidase [Shouchella clausii]MED4158384.1 type I methionyl aminopeptidase [Shouchella clausii]MED4177766.1 type I methionyl aminopeptidase [Shouchella clausii]